MCKSMKLCYVLPSPTFGMHQYTADLANRMSAAGHEVALVTTSQMPSGRYAPEIQIVTPVDYRSTGFSLEGVNPRPSKRIIDAVVEISPDVIHFTGPHLWNLQLVKNLTRCRYPVVHTIHDLVPHSGMRMGSLLGLWNRLIIRRADHILVHGRRYRQMLLKSGLSPEKVTYAPLLHLFVGYEKERTLVDASVTIQDPNYEPFALCFGRLQKYKGIDNLLTAFKSLDGQKAVNLQLVLAGPGQISPIWPGELPNNVKLINKMIDDESAVDLFRGCGLLVLPYTAATQSALPAAAYFFQKPVIVTDSGALPEYVVEGETGYVVRAGHSSTLRHKIVEAFESVDRLQLMGKAGRKWYEEHRIQEFAIVCNLYAGLLRNKAA